ncbi:hypothetical protein BIY27_25890 [Gibbsiella quercinecans]|uniref:hypothetical protein n=1 Tax=Gibbsiella quercinecans TaxID=929813 RepID=UPI000EF1C155|nr:hypothetical protein [Gibbsiella quercinecans]RLM02085.1 hypothetical protein BIY27_25890 [Gibbsiella quercinecans]
MMNPLGKYQEWANHVIGERLSGVRGLIYVFETPDFEHPQQLQFIFSNTESIASFRCGKDGSTLDVTDFPVQGNDLGEYGKEIIMDVSNSTFFVDYIGKSLLKAYSIFSSIEDSYIGIKLVFESGLSLIVVNVGDELNISDSLSSSYEHDEGIKYQEL